MTSLFIVADGLGGLSEGKFASRQAIAYFASEFRPGVMSAANQIPEEMLRALISASGRLHEESRRMGVRLGTTFTAAHIRGPTLHFVHVGDSALWHINRREETCAVITREDTVEREYIQQGRLDILASRYRHVLTQAVGLNGNLDPQTGHVDVGEGDIVVICSDGFYGVVQPAEVLETALRYEQAFEIGEALRGTAVAREPVDNFSAIIMRIGGPHA